MPVDLTAQRRLDHLDSIRGIASVVVLVDHVWSMNAEAFRSAHHHLGSAFSSFSDVLLYCLAKMEEGGRSAVILFFVLSGFVLAYSLKQNPLPYTGYAIKRIFRIVPAFVVVILISFMLHSLIGVPHLSESEWVRHSVDSADTSGRMLLDTIFFSGTDGSHGLDGVDWSLVHEMRISLIFPLLLIWVTRFRWLSVVALLVLSIVCTEASFFRKGIILTGFQEPTLLETFLDTSYFLVFFAAGACLSLEHSRVAEVVSRLPASVKGLLFLLAAFAFLKTDADIHSPTGCLVDYLRGLGATVLIALSLGVGSFRNALQHRLSIWLGRISYSLYLVHLPILYAVDQLAFGLPIGLIGVIVVVLSFVGAMLLSEFVEFPSMSVGKRLAARIPSLAPAFTK
jgi:peptidoglycan/LPS O-acetylase OafA/YrhL